MNGTVTTADDQVLYRIGFSTHSSAAQIGCEWKFQDFSDVTRYFTWVSEKEARAKHVVLWAPRDASKECHSSLVDAPLGMSQVALASYLVKHGIDPNKFG